MLCVFQILNLELVWGCRGNGKRICVALSPANTFIPAVMDHLYAFKALLLFFFNFIKNLLSKWIINSNWKSPVDTGKWREAVMSHLLCPPFLCPLPQPATTSLFFELILGSLSTSKVVKEGLSAGWSSRCSGHRCSVTWAGWDLYFSGSPSPLLGESKMWP